LINEKRDELADRTTPKNGGQESFLKGKILPLKYMNARRITKRKHDVSEDMIHEYSRY
jgi:hypothetical protein